MPIKSKLPVKSKFTYSNLLGDYFFIEHVSKTKLALLLITDIYTIYALKFSERSADLHAVTQKQSMGVSAL